MTFPRLVSLCCAAALAACGSSGGSGRLTVRIVDAPADVKELWLDVRKVEIGGPGGWQTISEPADGPFDVMKLRGGVSRTLADKTLGAGTYSQLRLVLGPANEVVLADGTRHDLKVPSGQQSGVKLVGSFEVVANTTKDVYVDFLAHRSIFVHQAGASSQWLLRPTIRSYDKLETGAVTGRLVDAATQGPLAGAEVMAETVDAAGHAAVVRTVTTDANGAYVLDLLPAGGSYHVVAQPRAGGAVYAAKASGPIAITAAAPTATWNGAFDAVAQAGAVTGGITPPGDTDDDVVLALQTLDAGGAPARLVVRTVAAFLTDAAEHYAIESLAPGDYALLAVRRTVDAAGDSTERTTAAVEVTVVGAATTVQDLAFE